MREHIDGITKKMSIIMGVHISMSTTSWHDSVFCGIHVPPLANRKQHPRLKKVKGN